MSSLNRSTRTAVSTSTPDLTLHDPRKANSSDTVASRNGNGGFDHNGQDDGAHRDESHKDEKAAGRTVSLPDDIDNEGDTDHQGSESEQRRGVKEPYTRSIKARSWNLVKGAHRKDVENPHWIAKPERDGEEWLGHEARAVEWLPLFYDLVVVAVLSTFSSQHEVSAPADIPVFLSFFVIIYWTWTSQMTYDMRFQGNDLLNRLFKFAQISVFLYQAAASGAWNPQNIRVWSESESEDEQDDYGRELASHENALVSWRTVVAAYAVGRALLALQYALCAFQGRRIGRNVRHIYLTLIALLISMILAIASAAAPSNTIGDKVAKIVIFYLGIGIELADQWVQTVFDISPDIPTERIGERYGAFLLIIIGEGFIALARTFNSTVSGLSPTEPLPYVQVFLAIIILFLVWAFLFGRFDREDRTGKGRAAIWQSLHFPLTFGFLLMNYAIENTVKGQAAVYGVVRVFLGFSDLFVQTIQTSEVPAEQLAQANRYFSQLSLQPQVPQAIIGFGNLYYQAQNYTSGQGPVPAANWAVLYDQYQAQLLNLAWAYYGVEGSSYIEETYNELSLLDAAWHTDETTRNMIDEEAQDLLRRIFVGQINYALEGSLWLLPTAGFVLILAALRSMAWYHFTGRSHYLLHLPQIIFGVILCLLGMLAIGTQGIDYQKVAQGDFDLFGDLNPLYWIAANGALLGMVAGMYVVTWVVTAGILWGYGRWRAGKGRGAKNNDRAREHLA